MTATAAWASEEDPDGMLCAVVESADQGKIMLDVESAEKNIAVSSIDYPEGIQPALGEIVVVPAALATHEAGARTSLADPSIGPSPQVRSLRVPDDTVLRADTVVDVPGGRFEVLAETVIEDEGEGNRYAFVTTARDGADVVPRALAIVYRP